MADAAVIPPCLLLLSRGRILAQAELRACVFSALDEQEVSVNGCGEHAVTRRQAHWVGSALFFLNFRPAQAWHSAHSTRSAPC